jgi:hypothetical protein
LYILRGTAFCIFYEKQEVLIDKVLHHFIYLSVVSRNDDLRLPGIPFSKGLAYQLAITFSCLRNAVHGDRCLVGKKHMRGVNGHAVANGSGTNWLGKCIYPGYRY